VFRIQNYLANNNENTGGNMEHIAARNVSDGLYLTKLSLLEVGKKENTRNGWVLEFPTPFCVTYTHPTERVLFYPERDANPFFHLMESLWMLAGRNDVEWISKYNKRISDYSDNGRTFHGAYGHRWRNHFRGGPKEFKDQLDQVMIRLHKFPNDRRAVVSMWDPNVDLVMHNDGKDYPCNTQIFFSKRGKVLNMTVINRSNDIVWGLFGANAVHMSMLQEYMAARTESEVGTYIHFSNNAHAYLDTLEKIKDMQPDYESYLIIGDDASQYHSQPLVDNWLTFDEELALWFRNEEVNVFENKFLSLTAFRVREGWHFWKQKNINKAIEICKTIEDRAWRKACVEWLERRNK
tara:strand:- start:1660 stop:2709 length:1050 start_codon:yes stop_codon:yes gene_type:complete